MRKLLGCLLGLCGVMWASEVAPTAKAFVTMVRQEHPRLFLTPEGIPALRKRATTTLRDEFAELCQKVDELPTAPTFQFKTDVCKVEGKKITFFRLLNDQNACCYAVKSTGGHEALTCALAYLVTGKESYRQKAIAHIKMNVDFTEYCHETKMLYEWYHYSRLNAMIAYDWIASSLSQSERERLMGPMLKHIAFMRNPGFLHNHGGIQSGNYGELALPYFMGLATLGDGIDDALARELLKEGYRHFVGMMDFRDYVSGNSGVLSSICSGYSFGAYPDSTFNFLRTLKSAAGIDGTVLWNQMTYYPQWFLWAVIPGERGPLEYGFGDSFHIRNDMPVWKMYTHLAQLIDLYGEKHPKTVAMAKSAMAFLPEKERIIRCGSFPILPYIMTHFDPADKSAQSVDEVLGYRTGMYFQNSGLVIMRSGFSKDDTFVAFKAGSRFPHHQHYDENSFIIYRNGFQAVDTGSRGNAVHHRFYYPQTIAHNAVIIRADKEPLPSYWCPIGVRNKKDIPYNDGGQNRMSAGHNVGFASTPWYAASGGDATACYSPKKCREASRILVFVKPNVIVTYDRVESVSADQEKAFVIHFNHEPKELQKGLQKGISEGGALFLQTLLPAEQETVKIGGPGKEFWTGGKNYPPYNYERYQKKPHNLGRWRLEIKDRKPQAKNRFLHVMQTAKAETERPVPAELFQEEGMDGVRFQPSAGRTVELRFRQSGALSGRIRIVENGKILCDQELYAYHREDDFELRHPARLDVVPGASGLSFEVSDEGDASLFEKPGWLAQGRGVLAQFSATSSWKSGDVVVTARGTGVARFLLRGPDVKEGGKPVKQWVEFRSVQVNGRELLREGKPVKVWHGSPVRLDVPVRDGQQLAITLTYRTARP